MYDLPVFSNINVNWPLNSEYYQVSEICFVFTNKFEIWLGCSLVIFLRLKSFQKFSVYLLFNMDKPQKNFGLREAIL